MNKYLDKLVQLEKSAGLDSVLSKAKDAGKTLLGTNVREAASNLSKTKQVAVNAGHREHLWGGEYAKRYTGYMDRSYAGAAHKISNVSPEPMARAHRVFRSSINRHGNLRDAVESSAKNLRVEQERTNVHRRVAGMGAAAVAGVGAAGYAATHRRKEEDDK